MAEEITEDMAEEIVLKIPSRARHLHLIRGVADSLASEMGFSDRERNRTVLALDEACANIIRHSCGENSNIIIDITFTVTEELLTITLRDFGKCGGGLDIEKIERDLGEVKPGGLGVCIIKSVMDTVEYTPDPKNGNVLVVTKKVC
ncbi:MAG: ATP-binding protein [Proteobacteria bacterium]|nr:ATP-binding protein [Pseudomonadota bacterium]